MAAAFPAEDWQQSNPSGQCSEEAAPAAAGPALGTARQAAASASEEESGWIWVCAVCLWPRCCYSRGGLSSLARAAAGLGLEFTACCHLTFVPVSMALFCRSSLYRFTDQFPPGLTDFCQCNYGAVWGGMLKSAQLCVVSGVHTLCWHGSAVVRR